MMMYMLLYDLQDTDIMPMKVHRIIAFGLTAKLK